MKKQTEKKKEAEASVSDQTGACPPHPPGRFKKGTMSKALEAALDAVENMGKNGKN